MSNTTSHDFKTNVIDDYLGDPAGMTEVEIVQAREDCQRAREACSPMIPNGIIHLTKLLNECELRLLVIRHLLNLRDTTRDFIEKYCSPDQIAEYAEIELNSGR